MYILLGDLVLLGRRKRPLPPLHPRTTDPWETRTNVQDTQTSHPLHPEATPTSCLCTLQLHHRIRYVLRKNSSRRWAEVNWNCTLITLDGLHKLLKYNNINDNSVDYLQVVHSVHGIMFKDLKQILRKEQCDASILLTANVPSAKKIIIDESQGKVKEVIYSKVWSVFNSCDFRHKFWGYSTTLRNFWRHPVLPTAQRRFHVFQVRWGW